MDVAEYSPQELTRLQLGWMIRENPGGNRGQQSGTRMQQRKRELQEGQQQARQEMLEDIGVH